MASTYVNNLRLEEIGTGEQSGTWGDTTNTNLELIGQAVAWGERAIANASTDNITIADGALDADRCLGLKLTGGGQACTVSLLPNTSSKTWFMYNATAADLTFTCGSGANVVIPAGQTKVIATDGLGSGGVVHDLLTAVNLAGTTVVDDLTVSDDLTVTDDLIVGGDIDLEGSIDVNGTTNLDVVDIDGAVDMASTLAIGGIATVNRIINATNSSDPWLKGVNSSGTETSFIQQAGNAFFAGNVDINGNIDVDGTTNLDATNIVGALDVTGTITSDGLTVDGEGIISSATTVTDLSNPILQLTGSSYTANGVYGIGFNYNTDGSGTSPVFAGYQLTSGSGNTKGNLVFGTRDTTTAGDVPLIRQKIASNGDINFYASDGTTPAFHWDAADERLGIGTTAPSVNGLEVSGSGDRFIFLQSSTSSDGVYIKADSGGDGTEFQTAGGQNKFGFRTNGSLALTIDSNQNVGIGGISPTSYDAEADNLVVASSGHTGITIASTGSNQRTNLYFADGTSGSAPYRGGFSYDHNDDSLIVRTSGAAAMTLDSSGNVGIGVAPTDPSSFGRILQLHGTSSSVMRFTGSTYGVGANDAPYIGMSFGGMEINNPRSNGYIHLSTNGSVTAKIESNGDVTIEDGNLVIGTAGKGIDFSAQTQSPNYTAQSEILDHYEEGAWTPTWVAASGTIATNSNTSGKYTRIGRVVYIEGYISYQSNSSASGAISVAGLPFTAVTTGFGQSSNQAGGVSSFANSLWSSNAPNAGRIPANTATIIPNITTATGATITQFSDFNLGANFSQFVFFGHYLVNQ